MMCNGVKIYIYICIVLCVSDMSILYCVSFWFNHIITEYVWGIDFVYVIMFGCRHLRVDRIDLNIQLTCKLILLYILDK